MHLCASSSIRRQTSFRSYNPFFTSFAMHWGVEKMISDVCHIFFLFAASTSPVNNCISPKSSGRYSLKYLKCCSAKGLVGARKTTFSPGNCFILSIVSIRAMRVFPNPVGRTTKQFFFIHVSRIAF